MLACFKQAFQTKSVVPGPATFQAKQMQILAQRPCVPILHVLFSIIKKQKMIDDNEIMKG